MANISVELTNQEMDALREQAAHWSLTLEELVRVGVRSVLGVSDPEFETIAAQVLDQNSELYRRLAG